MKSETRVLLTSCIETLCFGVILRGDSIDGAVCGTDCSELCRDLEIHGYRGETRFSVGPCSCGLPLPPVLTESTLAWSALLDKIIHIASRVMKVYAALRGEHMRSSEQ